MRIDAAEMVVDPEVLTALEEAAAEKKGSEIRAGRRQSSVRRGTEKRQGARARRPPPHPPRRGCCRLGVPFPADRAHLSKHGIKAVIPEKADQAANRKKRGSAGGRPVSHNAEQYKDRNTVERCIDRIRAWRGLATRYDKIPDSYMAGLQLRSSIIWMCSLDPAT